MRIETGKGFSMVDACHIVPFGLSKNDSIKNGIALCPNLHRAFDRGLIGINTEYRVEVSSSFEELPTDYGLKKLSGKSIILPFGRQYHPAKQHLQWHLDHVFLR